MNIARLHPTTLPGDVKRTGELKLFFSNKDRGAGKNMASFRKYIIALTMVLFSFQAGASTEILVFKDGKTLEVENIQEQDDKIFFLFHGIKSSVAKVDVERIELLNSTPSQMVSTPREKQIITRQTPPAPKKTMRPLRKYPTKKRPDPPDKAKPKTNVFRLDGFRELPWGELVANVDDLKILVPENSMDGVEEYVRSNEVLKIGPATVESIIYGFWQDRLYTVTTWTKGRSNYLGLQQAVFNEFGSGYKTSKAAEKYVWSDTKADRMLEYTKSSKHGMFWMRSRKLDRQYHLVQLKGPASYLKRIKRDSY